MAVASPGNNLPRRFLGLWPRAVAALGAMGLAEPFEEACRPHRIRPAGYRCPRGRWLSRDSGRLADQVSTTAPPRGPPPPATAACNRTFRQDPSIAGTRPGAGDGQGADGAGVWVRTCRENALLTLLHAPPGGTPPPRPNIGAASAAASADSVARLAGSGSGG
jgi:hypothetical protein